MKTSTPDLAGDGGAARVGIRYGDTMLAVNGRPTPDWGSYIEARALARDEMVVEIFRGGAYETHRLALDRTTAVDPMQLLSDLIDQRVLAPAGERDGEPEPS